MFGYWTTALREGHHPPCGDWMFLPLRRMRLMVRLVKDLRTGVGVTAESRVTLAGAITKAVASRHL